MHRSAYFGDCCARLPLWVSLVIQQWLFVNSLLLQTRVNYRWRYSLNWCLPRQDRIHESYNQGYPDSSRHQMPVLRHQYFTAHFRLGTSDKPRWPFMKLCMTQKHFYDLKMIQNVTSREHINMLWSYVMIIGHFFSWRLANIKSSISIGQNLPFWNYLVCC